MKTRIYIDGSEGTTGLRIHERLEGREDIELLRIDPERRKDPLERQKMIHESDITFLCLPDAAAKEAVSLVTEDHVRIIDASTAHRTEKGWAYGFPELSSEFRKNIREGRRIANPGCHASGFIALAYPLVKEGILPADYPVVSYSLTGYSGGGKKMIAAYESKERPGELDSPRAYALTQQHKHLKEMQVISGLTKEPLFTPIVADYYSGMIVSLPVDSGLLKKPMSAVQMRDFFTEYYRGEKFIHVLDAKQTDALGGFFAGNARSGFDDMEILVSGTEDRIYMAARFDNLGKGASGAAVQCMNLMMGCPEETGLIL